jgi:hypothetical protein
MSYNQLGALLALLEAGMQLFVPRAWAQRELGAADARRDTEMAALAYAHACDLLINKPLVGGGEIGFLFSKRAR